MRWFTIRNFVVVVWIIVLILLSTRIERVNKGKDKPEIVVPALMVCHESTLPPPDVPTE